MTQIDSMREIIHPVYNVSSAITRSANCFTVQQICHQMDTNYMGVLTCGFLPLFYIISFEQELLNWKSSLVRLVPQILIL